METLNEQDLDYLNNVENKLIRFRKREAANTNSRLMIDDLTELIEKCHQVRQWLQSRFELLIDKNL